MFSRKASAFSYCGEYFANCDVSGNIIIWETSSNTIKKVYDINSHLKQTCSTLKWGSFKNIGVGKNDGNDETQLLIIGTTAGDIYIYDFLSDKLFSQFESSHTNAVNDFSLDLNSSCLFSCSSDKSVIVWNVISGKIKQKWKPSDEEIYSICIVDDNNLLIGSTSISLWNIKNQEIIKTFCSCDAPVTLLTLIKSADLSSSSYFLSAASGIPKISAWCLYEENNQKAVATFKLPDELLNIDVTSCFSKNDPMLLSAVTKSGSLVLFQHVLNGKSRKLSPVMTLRIISKANSNENKTHSIPIISSKLLYCAEACIISYGSDSNLTFESVNIFGCPKTLTLARDKPSQHQRIKNISKVKLCKRLNDFTAVNGRASPVDSPHCSPGKKKRQEIHTGILNTPQKEAVDNTLHKVSTDNRITPKSSNVKTKHKSSKVKKDKSDSSESDSELLTTTDPSEMVDIILRGIQEDRPSLINSVLKCDNLELIKSTVRSLPLDSLNLILLELYRRLVLQENRYKSSYRRWLKEILSVHLPYLITCKDLTDTINRLKTFIDKRKVGENLLKMNMLRGLIKIQIQNLSRNECEKSSSDDDEELMES